MKEKDWKNIKSDIDRLLRDAEAESAVLEPLLRALKQFEAKNLIVVVTGLLKAGKSTLVNLLADNCNVSPVGYGVDTTLRPALIVSGGREFAGQGGIEVFLPKKALMEEKIDDSRKQKYRHYLMMNVLDYLRLKDAKLDPYIEKKVYSGLDKNDKRLKRILCTKPDEHDKYVPREPLLVVIHAPESKDSLLRKENAGKHGIMLLDMPGLDSGNMDVETAKLYREMLRESDMVVFLQSSVAPLNEEGIKIFKDIVGERDDLTAWIVHNKMNMKPWLRPDVIRRENQQQIDHTRDYLRNILVGSRDRDVNPQNVNLGLAFDSVFNQRIIDDQWQNLECADKTPFELSEFPEFKEKIRKNVNERGGELHELHCRENLHVAVSKLVDSWEIKKKVKLDKLNHLGDLEKCFNRASQKLNSVKSSPLNMLNEYKSKIWGWEVLMTKMKRIYDAVYKNNLNPGNRSERMLSEVDEKLREFGDDCRDAVNEYLPKLDIWEDIRWSGNPNMKDMNMTEILKESQAVLFEGVNDDDRVKYLQFPKKKKELDDMSGWSKLSRISPHKPFKKTVPRKWWFGDREVLGTYEQKDVEDARDGYIKGYLESAYMMMDQLDKEIRSDLLKSAKEICEDVIRKGIDKVKDEKKELQKSVEELSEQIGKLRDIREKI